jgi:hypothetical protein
MSRANERNYRKQSTDRHHSHNYGKRRENFDFSDDDERIVDKRVQKYSTERH